MPRLKRGMTGERIRVGYATAVARSFSAEMSSTAVANSPYFSCADLTRVGYSSPTKARPAKKPRLIATQRHCFRV
jgi:hypothetical protein